MLDLGVDDAGHGVFLRDGEPHQLITGALHYFRVPRELWEDRLRRLVALGCTGLETYVAWNFHQPQPDRPPSFDGDRDLGAFLSLAAELGLDLLVRPGPYICAEWDLGGLPSWLLADPAVRRAMRSSDPAWLDPVRRWFEQLLPVIIPHLSSRGGRVLAVQVENEYGSYGNDHRYLEALAELLTGLGVDVPLFTSDGPEPLMLAGGTLPGRLATVNFGSRQRQAFAALRTFRADSPTMCMEFWNGWFDHWGHPHHVRDAAEAAAELDAMLTDGHSVNLYLAHGGSNVGGWAGANMIERDGHPVLQPTATSYDYDAPIAEDGGLTAKFWAFREVIGRHRGVELPEPPAPAERLAPRTLDTTAGPSLGTVLDRCPVVTGATPRSFEELGVRHGVVRYRTELGDLAGSGSGSGEVRRELHLDGPVDLARVEVGDTDRLVSPLGLDEAFAPSCRIDPTGADRLDVTVWSLGRVNFGPYLGVGKGLDRVRLDHQTRFGFAHAPLELTELPDLTGLADDAATGGPGFHRASVELDRPADGYLDLTGWHQGYVYLNGHNLGRYWRIGPQRTLYAPAPFWRAGTNEIVVCELVRPGRTVALVDGLDLGPTT